MRNTIDISTKSDIINFIVFKRRVRYYLKKASHILLLVFFVLALSMCIYYRDFFIKAFQITSTAFGQITNKIFSSKPATIVAVIDKNTAMEDEEINKILKQLTKDGFDRKKIKVAIEKITNENKLISNIHVQRILATNEIRVSIQEKQILAILLQDPNNENANEYDKKIITVDGDTIPYRKTKHNDKIKIYGYYDKSLNLEKIISTLQKYKLLDKISYIKFYPSHRFDLKLKNGLLIKLPRKNWQKSLTKFIQIDSEYLVSNGLNNVNYIDLRADEKITVNIKS